MQNLIPWIIMSFREWLEAFLIIVLILKFLEKTGNKHLKLNVSYWLIASILISIWIWYLLYLLGNSIKDVEIVWDTWWSIASLIAVLLVTTFIIWMIQHSKNIKSHIESKAAKKLSKLWIFVISFIMTAREWVEIAIFAFAWEYPFLSILIWILISAILAIIVYYSLVKINITTIFKITLVYLIIQAWYLLGYSIHEWIWSLQSIWYLNQDNIIFIKAYDLYWTILNHKQWIIWLPLNVLFGWYSKPEWIQLLIQYTFTIWLLTYWYKHNKKS